MKTVIGLFLGVFLVIAWWTVPPTERWVDVAKSHTGHDIPVHREVEFHFGGGELSNALTRWPNTFSLEFKNPFDGKKISWQGEENVRPVLLDVVNGSAWLVINSSAVYADVKKYGCPEIDYVFLTYSPKSGHWIPVGPSNAPSELREANLSYGYEPYLMSDSRILDADQIASHLHSAEVSTGGHLTRLIPRNFDQWKYEYKRSSATSRVPNDCRPPLEQPVDYMAAGGSSKNVKLEELASEVIEPELLIREVPNSSESLWGAYSWDKERALACGDRIKRADDQDQRLTTWQRFVRDTSGKKVFPNSYSWFCDSDVVWLFGHGTTEPGRVVITKNTNNGDLLYKVSFAKPAVSIGSAGTMRISTFRAKDGFVYFDWVSFDSGGYEWRVKHSTKFRFQEPSNLPPRPSNGQAP